MPTYVSLTSWTEQGIKNYKDTVDRAQAAADGIASAGGSLRDIYYTLGAYDIIVIADFPDDETATGFLLKLGAQGNVRTTSMRGSRATRCRAFSKGPRQSERAAPGGAALRVLTSQS